MLRVRQFMTILIKKGLDIPLAGESLPDIEPSSPISHVAIVGYDYHQVKTLPTMIVEVGDKVRMGQPLARGKAYTDVLSTAPGGGEVVAIHRGPRRVVETVVIKLDDDEQCETFNRYSEAEIADLNRTQVVENLLQSGFWRALRTRPFSMVPNPRAIPQALFITAMDTAPLAPDPGVIIEHARKEFMHGVTVLSKLSGGKTYVCKLAGSGIPVPKIDNVITAEFSGPHPAGLVGTHIHFLHPAGIGREVWHVGYSDVIAIGKLFSTGEFPFERIIGLCGPAAAKPRLIRTRGGASTNELVAGEIKGHEATRVISGSVLNGRRAVGNTAYLGRFHNQVTLLHEAEGREFMGWLKLGSERFSISNAFASSLDRFRKYPFTTTLNGSARAMVPIGSYEEVMPLDILPTQLLRALIVDDAESAEALGCLELDEEDLALCTFVDTGKHDFGPILRRNLRQIWKDNQ